MTYAPTMASLRSRPMPDWFDEVKLGIFVHWGLYSVPGWAPARGEYDQIIRDQGWAAWFARNPYAEWYQNSLRTEGSPTHQHHMQTYGSHFSYADFVPRFNQAIADWEPDEWADLFQQAGAGYVVLTSKHHDGFLLWPSRTPNPHRPGYVASRDLVGELATAVRSRGIRMGLYYSGGLDWTFSRTPVRDVVDLLTTVPQGPDYVNYSNNHWRELIKFYRPSVLWNDIGYPASTDLKELFADYYNLVPEGVVNDRWTQFKAATSRLFRNRLVQAVMSRLLAWNLSRSASPPARGHLDFRTAEYTTFSKIMIQKWEAARGIGYSFGYNQNEGPEHCISIEDLVHTFADIVSKNGNLLLNVGPMANGTIPDLQRERLLGLGQWLAVNGEAIYGTRPWVYAGARTREGLDARFTQNGRALYAILLGSPEGSQVTFESLLVDEGTEIHLLGEEAALDWQQEGENLKIRLPAVRPDSPAYTLRLAPRRAGTADG